MNKEIKFPFDIDELFNKCSKNDNFPKNDFEKQAILLKLLKEFKDNNKYSEIEVNNIIKKYFSDYATLRRELVNYGYMQKDNLKSEYWVVKRTLTEEDIQKNIRLKNHAKSYNILNEE